MAAEEQIALIDLAAEMPKDSTDYFDWIHHSLEGARVVAAIVEAEMLELLADQQPGQSTGIGILTGLFRSADK